MIRVNSAISVSVDNGFLRVIGEISIGGSKKEKEAFVSEIQWNLLGDHKELPPNALLRSAFTRALRGRRRNLHRTLKIVFVQLPPRREKGERSRGPKYTRTSERAIRYPIDELDKWLANRERYEACCEEPQNVKNNNTPTNSLLRHIQAVHDGLSAMGSSLR